MASIRFQITQEMVGRFAELTGDQSSLHLDASFARRSPYRRRVVHGMLPVMFLSRCGLLSKDRPHGHLVALSARFLKPVFPDDELVLNVSGEVVATGDAVAYDYTISRVTSGEHVTAGTLRVVVQGTTACREPDTDPGPHETSIVLEPLKERIATFEDIAKGEETSFPIRITKAHIIAFREVLSDGLKATVDEGEDGLDLPLLYAACSSTYVGMCMPGRYATFIELVSTWDAFRESPEEATFEGEVTFLSSSTHMAVAQFTVGSSERATPLGEGRIKVRVNDPPTVMPSMAEIQQKGTTLGLRGRVVLVTGASRGIGETIAKMFGAHGARVIVHYHQGVEDAQRVVHEIREAGSEAISEKADVTVSQDVFRLVTEAAHAFGPVEVLVNNAVGDYESRAFQEWHWADVERAVDVIVKGAFNGCQAVLPAMVERGFGRIINMSTVAVENPPVGPLGYVLAKSALLGLTRSLAVEYAAHNIRVNAVAPSLVETDLTSHVSWMARETIRQETPMKRHALPLEVAQAVLYLASDWSSYTTGQQLLVTGGQPPFH